MLVVNHSVCAAKDYYVRFEIHVMAAHVPLRCHVYLFNLWRAEPNKYDTCNRQHIPYMSFIYLHTPHVHVLDIFIIAPLLFLASVVHYENMPMQYTVIFQGCKKYNFQMKKCYIFLIFVQNIDCGYSLEPPYYGGSNVYPQYMF